MNLWSFLDRVHEPVATRVLGRFLAKVAGLGAAGGIVFAIVVIYPSHAFGDRFLSAFMPSLGGAGWAYAKCAIIAGVIAAFVAGATCIALRMFRNGDKPSLFAPAAIVMVFSSWGISHTAQYYARGQFAEVRATREVLDALMPGEASEFTEAFWTPTMNAVDAEEAALHESMWWRGLLLGGPGVFFFIGISTFLTLRNASSDALTDEMMRGLGIFNGMAAGFLVCEWFAGAALIIQLGIVGLIVAMVLRAAKTEIPMIALSHRLGLAGIALGFLYHMFFGGETLMAKVEDLACVAIAAGVASILVFPLPRGAIHSQQAEDQPIPEPPPVHAAASAHTDEGAVGRQEDAGSS